MTATCMDNRKRYGSVTRFLHWLMAVLFVWQFASVLAHALAEDSALDSFLWPTHKSVGTLLMLLILVRILWALTNTGRRPAPVSLPARLGHGALYLLMLCIPLVGLLRQFGGGRAFSPFGIPFMPGFEGEKITWMVDLGSNFHGLMGWILLVAIVGHVAAAFWHYFSGQPEVMRRIIGRQDEAPRA